MLTIAAAMANGRPAFVSPPDKREEANAAKRSLAAAAFTQKSDHLALIGAAHRGGGGGHIPVRSWAHPGAGLPWEGWHGAAPGPGPTTLCPVLLCCGRGLQRLGGGQAAGWAPCGC